MKKILMSSIIFLTMVIPAMAANVTLSVVVPDAWVAPTIEAVQEKWPMPADWYPEEVFGVRIKRWTEHRIRAWLQNIVAPYKDAQDKAAALTTGGYVPTSDADVPIEISE